MGRELGPGSLHVATDILILTVGGGQLQLLLSRRVAPPGEGIWALPGRLVRPEESAGDSVRRLLDEMLPGCETAVEQLYTFTDPGRDPRGRVISITYLATLPASRLAARLAEGRTPLRRFAVSLEEAGSLRLAGEDGEMLAGADLAFDHGRIIETGVVRLRNKIDYSDIGFSFLENPEAFALSELQTIFEGVLGRKLDDSNFRRFILNRYEKAGRLRQTELTEKRPRGRPAALYRLER